jgi:hypothetical protein
MRYREIWNCDFEYQRPDDSRDPPRVVCMVVRELHTGREIRLFHDELAQLTAPPFNIGPDACFVSFAVAAEASCFAALRWVAPCHIVDLHAENLLHLNGRPRRKGDAGLLAALERYGLPAMTAMHKETMRDKIMRQADWSGEERTEILDYCAEDVVASERLLLAMDRRGEIDWPQALWRGAYMFATAYIEHVGIPVDADLYFRLRERWEAIRLRMIERIDRDYGVFVDGSFNRARFSAWLAAHDIPWSRLASGVLALDQKTFKAQAKAHPVLGPLRELTLTLAQMRSTGLTIGADHRNRFWMRPLLSLTGRNQPSSSANILGSAAWMRGLVMAPPGYVLAMIDWSAQEIAIAAGLSGDERLRAAYASGDLHMETAIVTGLAPPGATRETHPLERERIKPVSLGTGYGISARGVAAAIGVSRAEGRMILEAHRRAYPVFWRWLQRTVDSAVLMGEMTAPMGWHMAITGDPNPRTLQNWMMQATGAEMLRAAVVKMMQIGLTPCALAHDAIMVQIPVERMNIDIAQAQEIMERASLSFTSGLRVRTTARVLLPGQRLLEKRGERMWSLMLKLLAEVENDGSHEVDEVNGVDGVDDPHAMGSRWHIRKKKKDKREDISLSLSQESRIKSEVARAREAQP